MPERDARVDPVAAARYYESQRKKPYGYLDPIFYYRAVDDIVQSAKQMYHDALLENQDEVLTSLSSESSRRREVLEKEMKRFEQQKRERAIQEIREKFKERTGKTMEEHAEELERKMKSGGKN